MAIVGGGGILWMVMEKVKHKFPEIRGWFEKSVQSQRVGTTGAYRCYFQLVSCLGETHTKCQSNWSITLCLAFV